MTPLEKSNTFLTCCLDHSLLFQATLGLVFLAFLSRLRSLYDICVYEVLVFVLSVIVTQPVCSPNDPTLRCWVTLPACMYLLPLLNLVTSDFARPHSQLP